MQLTDEIIAMIKNEVTNEVNKLVADFTKIKAAVEGKKEEEKKYVENINIPEYKYLDDRHNQLAKSSFTFDMTPGALQAMIDNLAIRCSYSTSQYFELEKEKKKEEKEKTTHIAYKIPEYIQEDGGKFTTLFTNADPQMYIDAMANELRLFQERREFLEAKMDKILEEKKAEVDKLKKENEELKEEIKCIRSDAVAFANDINGSIQGLVSDIKIDFMKKL